MEIQVITIKFFPFCSLFEIVHNKWEKYCHEYFCDHPLDLPKLLALEKVKLYAEDYLVQLLLSFTDKKAES